MEASIFILFSFWGNATQLSAIAQRRTKLVKCLAEQIELTKAAQNGSTYAPTKIRSITDAETGERKHVAVAKRVKSWTFNSDNGKLCVNVRYGARILDLGKGKTAVELASKRTCRYIGNNQRSPSTQALTFLRCFFCFTQTLATRKINVNFLTQKEQQWKKTHTTKIVPISSSS